MQFYKKFQNMMGEGKSLRNARYIFHTQEEAGR
jgi:hypothetical protein